MSYVGVNIGALTVKVAALRGDARSATVLAHQGRPLEILDEVLARPEFADAEYFGVSGQLGHISEVAAIQRALREVDGTFDAVASLGGESFLVYLLMDGRITNVLSHNKCAAGSGEFFVQQIGRMGLGMEEAIQRSFSGKVVPLASRCSVHCKSDITHKLNRNEATPEDILHTLHDSMANKVIALLEKGTRELKRVLLIGGVTRNEAMLAALRAKLPATEFVVLPESPWFEAWGTALLVRDSPSETSPKIAAQPGLGRLPPLHRYGERVQVIAAPPRQAPPEGPLVLGVDAGSTTTKAILLDPSTHGVVASHYGRTEGKSRGGDPRVSPGAHRTGGQSPDRVDRHNRIGTGTRRRLPRHRACLQRDLGPCSGRDTFRPGRGHDLRDRRAGLQVHLSAQRRSHRLRDE